MSKTLPLTLSCRSFSKSAYTNHKQLVKLILTQELLRQTTYWFKTSDRISKTWINMPFSNISAQINKSEIGINF